MDSVNADDDGHLREVYSVSEPAAVRDYYDGWADTYDAELEANGYASPRRVAAALAELASDLDEPVLDYGCGTGMSGRELAAAGFTTIDGADPSSEMLRVAEAKGIYRTLALLDLTADRPPFPSGHYAAVSAVGLIGPGAAPLALFDQLIDLVAPGGLFGVSFNDRALSDPSYPAKIAEHVADGGIENVFDEHGPHLPGLGVMSTVYVFRRQPPS